MYKNWGKGGPKIKNHSKNFRRTINIKSNIEIALFQSNEIKALYGLNSKCEKILFSMFSDNITLYTTIVERIECIINAFEFESLSKEDAIEFINANHELLNKPKIILSNTFAIISSLGNGKEILLNSAELLLMRTNGLNIYTAIRMLKKRGEVITIEKLINYISYCNVNTAELFSQYRQTNKNLSLIYKTIVDVYERKLKTFIELKPNEIESEDIRILKQ